jgi:thiaminase
MQATELVQKIRVDLESVDQAIRQHSFLDAVEKGEVSEQALRAFPGHQYHLMVSLIHANAHMLQRFGGTPFHDFFYGLLSGAITGYSSLMLLARRLGMGHESLEDFELDPDGFAYAGYMTWLADCGSVGETICGLAVNKPAWGQNCARLSSALRARYGFSTEETVFLDEYAGVTWEEEEALVKAVEYDLVCHVPIQRIGRAARLIQAYELRFWDAMARASGSLG